MTMWNPEIRQTDRPLYLAIADAVADAVAAGVLTPGQRLPTQRELAGRLGVAITTVTRAYGEAERRGLVSGQVGRGTYVGGAPGSESPAPADGPVDLRPNTLIPLPLMPELQESLGMLAREPGALELYDYGPHAGRDHHREAGATWIGGVGLECAAADVVITAGAQHAMTVALAAVATPGDVVLVEEVTYAGMKTLAGHLGLRLEPLPLDEEGLIPEALWAACRDHRPAALYTMPTLQNPTSAVMSESRRREVAEAVNSAGIAVVEDDSYGYLLPEPPRLASFCERAFYISGTSKSLLPALRIAYLLPPPGEVDRVEARIAATVYLASPWMAELSARWIADGTAERVMVWKRNEVRARQKLAMQLLGDLGYRAHEASPHGWLRLPEPWSGRDFARRAAERGVLVTPADVFAVTRGQAPRAVRVCVGAARSRATLERGLRALAATSAAGPEPLEFVV